MRNMYDYAYEYECQYHPERAGEMFAVVFASLWLAIMIGMLVFMLGSYLLHSFGLPIKVTNPDLKSSLISISFPALTLSHPVFLFSLQAFCASLYLPYCF